MYAIIHAQTGFVHDRTHRKKKNKLTMMVSSIYELANNIAPHTLSLVSPQFVKFAKGSKFAAA